MPSDVKSSKIPWHLIIVFLLMGIGIGVSGYIYDESQTVLIKKHVAEGALSHCGDEGPPDCELA